MMAISEREQETLDSIGDGLARSAPKLASMLAMFSRLTADEEMPVREPTRRAVRTLGPGATTLAGRMGSDRVHRLHLGRTTRGWLWILAAAALLALVLTLSYGTGRSTCPPSQTTACRQAPVPVHPGPNRPGGL